MFDYHTHSAYSFDGKDSFQAMLESAQKAGLTRLCVTDHCDMGTEQSFSARDRYDAFLEARAKNTTGVKLLLGIELGEAIHHPARAKAAVEEVPYDFVIGAYHMLRGERDFYYLEYKSEEHCHRLLARYFAELCELADWGMFDVLGHINYPLRFMPGLAGGLLPRYEPELRKLFGILNRKGIGIEFNVKKKSPFLDILGLYRECGGGIVTLGSDAHRADDVGRDIDWGIEMCRKAGLTHIAAYEQRKLRLTAYG